MAEILTELSDHAPECFRDFQEGAAGKYSQAAQKEIGPVTPDRFPA
jgi:hypothetical protein